jgi:hypothetical protein
MKWPNGLRFSCRRAAFANATNIRIVVASKTQKSCDLTRRKAVNCKRVFGRSRFADRLRWDDPYFPQHGQIEPTGPSITLLISSSSNDV